VLRRSKFEADHVLPRRTDADGRVRAAVLGERLPLGQRRCDMNVEMGVNATSDAISHAGHCHPLLLKVRDRTAPAGRADRTATGLCDRLLVGHFRPTRFGAERVLEPGRRINIKTRSQPVI
jgi:hypothetical protein